MISGRDNRATEVSKTRLEFGVGKACIDFRVKPIHDLLSFPKIIYARSDDANRTRTLMLDQNDDKQRPLTALEPGKIQVSDLARLPYMTRWFEPILLAKLLLRVIISDVFGQYADRRLISAALDTVSNERLRERTNISGCDSMAKDEPYGSTTSRTSAMASTPLTRSPICLPSLSFGWKNADIRCRAVISS